MIRAELRAQLLRWRESLAGLALAGLGGYWGLTSFGVLQWLGWAGVGLGAMLAVAGVQRARFRQPGQGPGVVTVDERQVTYFGPLSGGAVTLEALRALDLDRASRPAHWILYQDGQPPLAIPANAAGAEALFDAFAALPGLGTERMLAELQGPPGKVARIWARPSRALH